MAVIPIVQLGHPVLRALARALETDEIASREVQQLIDDMIETMRDAGGAGLAAPQVGVPLRLFVVEVADNPRYPYKPPIPLRVVINPTLRPRTDATFRSYEGCLSVPGIRGPLQRLTDIDLVYLDRAGRTIHERVWGMSAGTFQHELDHLDGILFLDRVEDTKLLTTWEEFRERVETGWLEAIKRMIEDAGILPG